MGSVKRMSEKEKEDAGKLAQIEAAKIDPDDMGCGQRCFFTYGQMCQRAAELFNCCLTDYDEAMQKERRWEETVKLKERVLKQRDHLIVLEKEQKVLLELMRAFQTDTSILIEETGDNVRKELKKAFRMEVDISTKELLQRHERLAREQNGMSEAIGEHETSLQDLGVKRDKIKRELNDTFTQLREVDEELKSHQESTAQKFLETKKEMEAEQSRVDLELTDLKTETHATKLDLQKEADSNTEQNMDIVRIKQAVETLRNEQLKKGGSDSLLSRIKKKVGGDETSESGESEYSVDEEGNQKLTDTGEPKKRQKRKKRSGGIAGKMKAFIGREEELSEEDLPDVPEEGVGERAPGDEDLIHTPDEGETPSEFELRTEQNENIVKEKQAVEKMEKRKLKKRAKRKQIAEQSKTLKKKNTKVAAAGDGGALPAHVTNG